MKISITTYLLLVIICFQLLCAIPAGLLMIIDTTGDKIGLPFELLKSSPFPNYLIPGLFLFLILGLFPIVIVYGLVGKPSWKLAEKFNPYKEVHWSLTFSYYFGLLLILWINMQLLFIQSYSFLQVVISLLGVFIIILTHAPSTLKAYRRQ
tara:strand:- start:299 stop:751 length:453 start_codon:yes stop_codon:yes gene_type:complete